ncbi:MAG: prepilin peptidase [Clostridiaceae bacterium]|jgi:leader peptidase (prepilin peptidase)/N-methyltransferase|nr:prepilin peptidase [Clostridiaceae bacterium]
MTIYSSTFFTFFGFFVAFLSGIVMGSFLNCAVMRMLSGEPIVRGRSHCMSCGHRLGVLDLIPLGSWLLLRGKCRYCGSKISARYPLSELVLGAVYVLILAKYDLTLRALELIVLCSLLFCITLCDLDQHIIPDRFIIIGIINRIIFILLTGNILEELKFSLIGAFSVSLPLLILSLILDKILKKDTMGGGDIKLFFMAGMYFAWSVNVLVLFMSAIIGIIFGLVTKKNEEKQIPFGPAVSIGYFLGMLGGSELVHLYSGLY